MYVVTGATGHIGSVVAKSLLERELPVTVVTRDPDKARGWESRGAQAAVLDILDPTALHDTFRNAKRAFLLNPPADPTTDTDTEENRTAAALAKAVKNSGLERAVVESTYGARPGHRLGDFNPLYNLEQAVATSGVPTGIIRGAYYFTNWDGQLETVRDTGVLTTMFPEDFELAMVAPADLGEAAAAMLAGEPEQVGLRYVEGPRSYTARDVAAAFSQALKREVRVESLPQEQWYDTFTAMGFSPAAAQSYERMTGIALQQPERPEHPTRGRTTLEEHVDRLVKTNP